MRNNVRGYKKKKMKGKKNGMSVRSVNTNCRQFENGRKNKKNYQKTK